MINPYSNASQFLNRAVSARDFVGEEDDKIDQQLNQFLGEGDPGQLQSEESSDEDHLDSVGRGEGSPAAAGR